MDEDEWWVLCRKSSAKSVGSLWSNVFGSVKLLLEVSVIVFQLLDLNQRWLHVLLHDCVVLVRSFWHVLDKCFQVLLGLRLWKGVLLIYDVFLDVFEGAVQLFNLFSFFIDNFVKFSDLLLEELLLFLEFLLFVLSFEGEFLEFLFELFAVDSIFGCGFLVLCGSFGNQELIILVLEWSDFHVFGVKLLLVLLKFGLGFGGGVEIVFGSAGHDLIDVIELGFGPEFSDFLMKFLYIQTIFFNSLIELFLEILYHSLFFPELLIFIIDDSL